MTDAFLINGYAMVAKTVLVMGLMKVTAQVSQYCYAKVLELLDCFSMLRVYYSKFFINLVHEIQTITKAFACSIVE